MRKINYYSGVLSLLVVCFFTSCTSTKYGAHFQPSNHAPSNYAGSEPVVEEEVLTVKDKEVDVELENVEKSSGAREAVKDFNPETENLATTAKVIDEKELLKRQEQNTMAVKERLSEMSRKEKRQLRKEIRKIKLSEYTKNLPFLGKNDVQQDGGGSVNIVALIFAILIPPLGVFIDQGVNEKFWISLLLTVVGVTSFIYLPAIGLLPAIAYSVLVVLGIV